MRQKRAKTYRKLMNLYSMSFGFRTPYQVLVDASFCVHATQNRIDIEKQLDTVFQGQTKPMMTQCCIVELYKLGSQHQQTVDVAKRFERRKCNHREAIEGDECIRAVVGDANKHRYAIATQSQILRESLRAVPFVPIVHINRVVMIIEPPSDATLRAKALMEHTAQGAKPPELAKIKISTTTSSTQPTSTTPADGSAPKNKKQKSGPKGPNPLSVKKKKAKEAPLPVSGSSAGKASKGPTNGSLRSQSRLPAAAAAPHTSSLIAPLDVVTVGKKRKRGDLDNIVADSRQQRTNPGNDVAPAARTAASPAAIDDDDAHGVPQRDDDAGASSNINHSSRGHRKKRRRRGKMGEEHVRVVAGSRSDAEADGDGEGDDP